MRKLVLFMHISLDGYVAGPEGEMEWISVDNEMFGYAGRLTDGADVALYGRRTYEMMEAYWPTAADQPGATEHDITHSRWYNKVKKVVVSTTMSDDPAKGREVIAADIPGEIRKLKQLPGKDILMFGSPSVAYALMRSQLVDDYWFFVNPVLLGEGIPMFKDIKDRIGLRLKECKTFTSGVVGLHYEKER
jgi:dihydrofolate reductase